MFFHVYLCCSFVPVFPFVSKIPIPFALFPLLFEWQLRLPTFFFFFFSHPVCQRMHGCSPPMHGLLCMSVCCQTL